MDGFFGIGLLELFLIAILALIVLGPERLPGAMRQIAGYIREIRRLGSELTSQFSDELQVLDELNPKRLIDEITDPNYDEKKAKPGAKPTAKPPVKPATKPLAAKPPAATTAATTATATVAATTAAAATEATHTTEAAESPAAPLPPEAGSDAPTAALNGGENTIMPPLPSAPPANGAADAPATEAPATPASPRQAEPTDEQQ